MRCDANNTVSGGYLHWYIARGGTSDPGCYDLGTILDCDFDRLVEILTQYRLGAGIYQLYRRGVGGFELFPVKHQLKIVNLGGRL